MRQIVRGSLLALAGGWCINAAAALVTYTGNCGTNCAELGLNNGDPVSAQITVSTGSSLANLRLSKNDVVSFVIDFGNIDLTEANLPTNWDFRLATDAAGNVADFKFLGSLGSPTSTAILGDSVDLRLSTWFAAQNGTCIILNPRAATACDLSQTGIFTFAPPGVIGQTAAITITNVPEPGSLALVMTALLGGLGRSLRRKA